MNNNNPFEVVTIFYLKGKITLATLPNKSTYTCYCENGPEAEIHLIS